MCAGPPRPASRARRPGRRSPTAVTIGGAAGQEFEASIPADGSRILVPETSQFEIDPDNRCRIFVLDVSGRTVVIIAGTTFGDYAASLPLFDRVLTTLKWEG